MEGAVFGSGMQLGTIFRMGRQRMVTAWAAAKGDTVVAVEDTGQVQTLLKHEVRRIVEQHAELALHWEAAQ